MPRKTSEPEQGEPVLTITEAAEFLNVDREILHLALQTGAIPATKGKWRWHIKRSTVESLHHRGVTTAGIRQIMSAHAGKLSQRALARTRRPSTQPDYRPRCRSHPDPVRAPETAYPDILESTLPLRSEQESTNLENALAQLGQAIQTVLQLLVTQAAHESFTISRAYAARISQRAEPEAPPARFTQTSPAGEAAQMLSVGEVSRLLGVSKSTIWRLINAGDLEVVWVAGRGVVESAALASWIAAHRGLDKRPHANHAEERG